MKKYDNFVSCFGALKRADKERAVTDDIYRTGVVGQFNLTFELAWKALQAVLRIHSVKGSEEGSPREILKLGYKVGFIQNSDVWLEMIKRRNTSLHLYNEEEVDELIAQIFEKYIPEFEVLLSVLKEKIEEAEETNWNN